LKSKHCGNEQIWISYLPTASASFKTITLSTGAGGTAIIEVEENDE